MLGKNGRCFRRKLTICFKDGELFVPYRSLILLVRADLFSVDCFCIKLAGAVKTKIKHKLKSINRKIIILFQACEVN